MVSFIDQHRSQYGVEPICAQLPIAPSTYYLHKARAADPGLIAPRRLRDQALLVHVQQVWEENFRVYGARKMWRQLNREGIRVARCTVERLMRRLGLRGVVRGKKRRTTSSDPQQGRVPDLVKRQFTATRPGQLWVADFTYVATQGGFVYTAFVIDVYGRSIVGWQVSASMKTDLVLAALNQALCSRRRIEGLIHHSDQGSQYLSIRYSERLAASESGHPPAPRATPTTTPWLRRLSDCIKPRSSGITALGQAGLLWSMPRLPGWIGSTTADCCHR